MTCPWRYLTATGEVLSCMLYSAPHERDEHVWWRDPSPVISWTSDADCAWDATCPDCVGRDPEWHDLTECMCVGLGVVEDVPARLIGVGSTLSKPGWSAVVVESVPAGFVLSAQHHTVDAGYRQTMLDADPLRSGWSVLRAVPPATDTETS